MPLPTVRSRRARTAALLAVLGALLVLPSAAFAGTGEGAFDGASLTGAAATLRAAAAAPPSGFQETVALSGLTNPMAVRFAPDGRIFVAEKSGRIKVFDDFGDPTPTVFADLSQQVHDFWDRGLMSIALDPQFSTRPYVYVLYAYNKDPNSTQFPRWGDSCPTPPGATADGCVISGRLSRIVGGVEQVLIEDWCQQYPSHSLGSLAFGQDGALYVSGGDGASFNFADYGQDGSPVNPCGDPPAPVGGAMTPPTAEGGALRSQDVRTTGDPTSLDGAILRVNPDSGAAMAGNPNTSSDPNARRIVAHGLRNPFRITIRPGTNEVWSGDVGWNDWEEINRVPTPTAEVRNFGWPCYEGTGRMDSYDNLNLSICENLYAQGTGAHAAPYYTYNHSARVVTGEACGTGSSSISGLAFNPPGGSFPASYNGALFFSDYSRDCIWAMLAGSNGLPDPNNRLTFVSGAANPVELQFGPGGDLYYVDLDGGTIRRVRALVTNRAPIARATATPSTGEVPLTVAFDGRASSDPDGSPITYAWDLDGDGAFDDSTSATPSFTYTVTGTYTARLRVTDPGGLTDTVNVPITAGTPPVPIITITSPSPDTKWKVDDTITFSGSATDHAGNPIPPSGLTWDINLEHCNRDSGSCHTHPLQSFGGVAGGSFPAPDHEFPSYLEIELTARDSQGLTGTATRRLDPKTVQLTLASQPAGLKLTLGSETVTAPFTREVIQGSTNGIGAETPQTLGGSAYTFASWSNAGARNHTTVINADTTLTATFERATAVKLAGADVIGSNVSRAEPGKAEVYRTTATNSGTATELNLYLSEESTASDLVLGLYADSGGQPTTLLGSGRLESLTAGAWNKVPVNIPNIDAGQAYWISLLNPADGSGTLRWHDRAGGTGGAEQTSWDESLTALPDTWRTGAVWSDGPASAYVFGAPAGPPPPPVLAVAPTSLSFSGTAGAANPAAKTLSVTNTGGGTLNFTASDDAPWLTVTPGTGTAPRDLSVAVNTAGLAAGTHTATVRVESAGADGSPKLIPVTLTLATAPPPALSVSPGSLSFSAVQGGAAPPGQTLNVANTGSGTLSFTASDNAPWLAVAPASGTAPAGLSVTANAAGLTPGTYSGSVTVTAAGATGSPATIPVTLNVTTAPPPASGLVGAWGFNETTGTTATDSSGAGNTGTLSGATRTTAGRYGGALSFDGVNDWVTVADSASLDLTTGITMEAWVRPAALGTTWRTVVLKEQPGQLSYALYGNTSTTRPSVHVYTNDDVGLRGPAALPLNTWTHLAATWNAVTMRLYVNGTEVANSPLTGTALTSSSPLRIGGNAVWPEWFSGLIDEVRVYNRALTAAQIAADRDTAIGGAALTRARAASGTRSKTHALRWIPRPNTRDANTMRPRPLRKVHRGTHWLKNMKPARARRGRR
jgi:PKD repeat protein/glucose/arabinose dehydrogenase